MYAIIQTGGKQYKVKAGDTVKVEKIEKGIGDAVTFDQVLMLVNGDKVELGAPYLAGKAVQGKVVEQGRHKKVRIIKFKRRKHSMKQMGHRQYFTAVEITDVAGTKAPAKVAEKAVPKAASTVKPAAKKTAASTAKKAAPKTAAAKKPAAKKTEK